MQQRRLRLGDILDDYCPRERRITNHVIVAMIDDTVKQTRCTTCDADHEYRHARIPTPRRRKDAAATMPAANLSEPDHVQDAFASPDETSSEITTPGEPAAPTDENVESEGDSVAASTEDEGPVHRRLIRATLPRPEGQSPERKMPEFTIRQPGGRGRDFDGNKIGGGDQRRGRGRRGMRGPQQGQPGGQQRFGGSNQSRHGSPQGRRHDGNRSGNTGGEHGGGRPGQGHHRGPRPPGRKRGR